MKQLKLEEIRDACADLMRNGEELEEDVEIRESDEDKPDLSREALLQRQLFRGKRKSALPDSWLSKREKRLRKQQSTQIGQLNFDDRQIIDFGTVENESSQRTKVRVKICGRYVYNYPSEKSMACGG